MLMLGVQDADSSSNLIFISWSKAWNYEQTDVPLTERRADRSADVIVFMRCLCECKSHCGAQWELWSDKRLMWRPVGELIICPCLPTPQGQSGGIYRGKRRRRKQAGQEGRRRRQKLQPCWLEQDGGLDRLLAPPLTSGIVGPQVSPPTPHFLIVFTAQASMQTAPDIIACPNAAFWWRSYFFSLFLQRQSICNPLMSGPQWRPPKTEKQQTPESDLSNNSHRKQRALSNHPGHNCHGHYCETKEVLGDSAGSAPSCPHAKGGHLQVNNNTLDNHWASNGRVKPEHILQTFNHHKRTF